jgi:hypothetical protein
MARKPRDYKKEYADYQGKPEQIKRRAQRNAARAAAVKAGKVRKGDNLEVDHVGANRKGALDNDRVRVIPKRRNRKKQPKRDGSED